MEISGKIFRVMPIVSGQSAKGTWQKQEIVIEVESGKFPKKVCVTVWGDLASDSKYQEGDDLSVEVDIESREYNGRWYTDIKAWRVNSAASGDATPSASAAPARATAAPSPISADLTSSLEPTDDLPF